MVLKIYTDGGSKGNPGPASIGMVIYRDGKAIIRYREDIGIATNNVAEYTAVIRAFEKIKEQKANLPARFAGASARRAGKSGSKDIEKIQFFSDSNLLVNQLNGLFKVKNAKIREFIFKIRNLEQEVGAPVSYTHIPRDKNKVADALVNNRL